MPKISVLMSFYKEPIEWLHESIDSILKQTFTDFEYIIILDNPNYREAIQIVKDYANKDNRIVLIFNEQNIGLTKSLNKGLEIAQGEYIARMDADDVSKPDRFKKQVAYLDGHTNCGICGSNFMYWGTRTGIKVYPEIITKDHLFLESPLAHPTVMIRSSFLGGARYNENYKVSQDFELWARLISDKYYYHNIQDILLLYRCSDKQIMSVSGGLQVQLSRTIRRSIVTRYALKYDDNFTFPNKVSFEFKRKLRNIPIRREDKKYLFFCIYTSN